MPILTGFRLRPILPAPGRTKRRSPYSMKELSAPFATPDAWELPILVTVEVRLPGMHRSDSLQTGIAWR